MATIEKINKVYKRLTDFQAALAAGEISDKRLYLIEDKRYMYINGVYYDCSTVDLSDYVTSEALTAALQPYALSSNLASVATSGSYNDLSNKPTIPSAVTESTVSGWGFTKNTGTITGIKMNGASKGTSGVVNLGNIPIGDGTITKIVYVSALPSNPDATTLYLIP